MAECVCEVLMLASLAVLWTWIMRKTPVAVEIAPPATEHVRLWRDERDGRRTCVAELDRVPPHPYRCVHEGFSYDRFSERDYLQVTR